MVISQKRREDDARFRRMAYEWMRGLQGQERAKNIWSGVQYILGGVLPKSKEMRRLYKQRLTMFLRTQRKKTENPIHVYSARKPEWGEWRWWILTTKDQANLILDWFNKHRKGLNRSIRRLQEVANQLPYLRPDIEELEKKMKSIDAVIESDIKKIKVKIAKKKKKGEEEET